tara:strand:- start:2034 stop:2870 length:837 start_codon:yes stop_codon:yes gene_type:complete
MKAIFDTVSYKSSEITTKLYSTSFSFGIKALHRGLHKPIYAIYGFVRLADEIVDSFHDFDKETLLLKFKHDTHQAIKDKISLNPILNSFQDVVNRYNIELELVDTFLESMEMDLKPMNYDESKYEKYILGSAQVVGLMCLKVFVNGNEIQYNALKPHAMSLGSAFQKINFLRDIKADYSNLGRTYFPNVDMNTFSFEDKVLIERDIQKDFEHALKGVKKLPKSSRAGVYLTYVYYYKLFEKIQSISYSKILSQRIRINNFRKMYLVLGTLLKSKFGLI